MEQSASTKERVSLAKRVVVLSLLSNCLKSNRDFISSASLVGRVPTMNQAQSSDRREPPYELREDSESQSIFLEYLEVIEQPGEYSASKLRATSTPLRSIQRL